ncbi:hypothetical protein CSM73_005302, partial [Salmonella enterica subsp. diarizonae]|nr:hypothetical protein [Salmonella enterica subsp. diarizonae]
EKVTKAFAEVSDNALVSINASLMDVNQSNMVASEKIIAGNEHLMDLNVGVNALLALMKKNSEFNEEMENKKTEQLKVIIDRQESYFHEQYKFKKKMKQIVEVLTNEN